MRFLIISIYLIFCVSVAMAQNEDSWGDGDNNENDREYVLKRGIWGGLASRHRADSLCYIYADSIYAEASRRNDRKGCVMALSHKALRHINYLHDMDSMRVWTDSVKAYSKQHQLPRYYYFIWSQYIGVLLDSDYNKRAAKDEIDKMLSEATADHYVVGQIECCRRLAHFYSYFGMYDKEYEMRIKEINLTEQYDADNINLPVYYAEVARACIAVGKYDEAEEYISKGDRVANTDISKLQLLKSRVDVAVNRDDKEAVLRLAKNIKSVDNAEGYGQKKTIEMYGCIYSGEYAKADSISDLLYKRHYISEGTRLSHIMFIAKKDLSHSYYNRNIDAVYRYRTVVDSIARVRISLLIDDSDLKLNLAVLETEKYNIEHKADSLRFHIVLLIGVFSLVVIAILVYYTSRLRRTNVSLKENQIALLRQKEIAEQANEMKAEVIRNMSHEIRTPLNAVVGFSEVLSQLADKNAREQQELSNKIQDSTSELLDILNSVIDMSDLETNLSLKATDAIPINVFCSNLIEKYLFKQSPSVSSRFYPLESEGFIQTNERCLRIAVDALLSNAYKFTTNGYVEVSILRDNNDIRIEVVDTGCGIQEHQINKIFERFYKGDQFTQGIGLGLPLCRLALSKIGASVEVSSAKDETGTVAVIKLPDSWINMG